MQNNLETWSDVFKRVFTIFAGTLSFVVLFIILIAILVKIGAFLKALSGIALGFYILCVACLFVAVFIVLLEIFIR